MPQCPGVGYLPRLRSKALSIWGCLLSKEQKEYVEGLRKQLRDCESALEKKAREPKFKWQDSLSVVGAILALAPFLTEDAPLLLCFIASALLLCISIRSHKEWRGWRYLLSVLVIGMFSLASYKAYFNAREKNLTKLQNVLIPADEPTPPNPCSTHISPAENGLFIMTGQTTSYVDRFPHTVISVDEQPRLTVNRKDKNAQISLDVFGPDGKIIANLDDDGFTVRQGSFFKFRRNDESSLRIVDEYNEEVLNVHYVNPHVIWLNAILRYQGSEPVIFRGSAGGGICTAHAGKSEIEVTTKKKPN